MKLTLRLKVMSALIACGAGFSAQAATAWNESLNGDFSNNGLAPTQVVLAAGADNVVSGTTGDAGQGVDRDYFTFTVPEGTVLTSLILLPNTFVSGSSSFLGLQAGPQMTVTPTGGGVQNLIGSIHYDGTMANADLLPLMFLAPLQSGTYSAWIQELGGVVDYSLNFNVWAAPVPVPAAAVLLVSGVLGLGAMRRRRSAATAA
jgi:hypothetical protein